MLVDRFVYNVNVNIAVQFEKFMMTVEFYMVGSFLIEPLSILNPSLPGKYQKLITLKGPCTRFKVGNISYN